MHKLWLPGSVVAVSLVALSLATTMPRTTPNANASVVLNNPINAQVTFVGTPVASQVPPIDAITLNPGESIPTNAPIGQPYLVSPTLPSNLKNELVIRLNPGQGYNVTGYSGPIVVESTAPDVVSLEPNPNYSSNASAAAVGDPALSSTWVVICTYSVKSPSSGGVIDFNGTWIADNHVVQYLPVGGGVYNPTATYITRSSAQYEVYDQNPTWVNDPSTGLAYLAGEAAPTGSAYTIDVVLNPTVGQPDTAVTYYNPINEGWQLTTQSEVLVATQVTPPDDPYPDPYSNIYHEFTPILAKGWSGNGTWDSENHLVAINTYGYDNSEYGFNGGDITAFCEEFGIPFTTSSGH